jgi:hypothetical protein
MIGCVRVEESSVTSRPWVRETFDGAWCIGKTEGKGETTRRGMTLVLMMSKVLGGSICELK